MRYCPNPRCPHRLGTGVAAELRDDVERCPDCATPLAPAPPPDPASPEWNELATIATFGQVHEAELARAKLRDEGIAAVVADAHVNQIMPLYAAALGWVRLQVPAGEAERASRVLAGDESVAVEEVAVEEAGGGVGEPVEERPERRLFPPWVVWAVMAAGALYLFRAARW